MKRLSFLLIVAMAFVVAACSGSPASSSPSATSVAETPEPTPIAEPSEAAETPAETATESEGSSSGSDLAGLLPDDLNGFPRTEVPGLDAIIGPALAAQGVDATDVDFIFASYGEGTDGLIVQAIRVPGLGQPQLEMLARMMAGQSTEVEVETVDVGGKSVLQMSGAEVPGAAYMYFADGAMFTIIGESSDLAAQLLAELP